MKRKTIAGIILSMLLFALHTSAFASPEGPDANFTFYFHNIYTGQNTDPMEKVPGYNFASITISYCSKSGAIPTNAIIVATNGVQKAYNTIVTPHNTGWMQYYDSSYLGYVMLRVNTGSTVADYGIMGHWNCNELLVD